MPRIQLGNPTLTAWMYNFLGAYYQMDSTEILMSKFESCTTEVSFEDYIVEIEIMMRQKK